MTTFDRLVEALYAWLVAPDGRPAARRRGLSRLLALLVCIAGPISLAATAHQFDQGPAALALSDAALVFLAFAAAVLGFAANRIAARAEAEHPEEFMAAPINPRTMIFATVATMALAGVSYALMWTGDAADPEWYSVLAMAVAAAALDTCTLLFVVALVLQSRAARRSARPADA